MGSKLQLMFHNNSNPEAELYSRYLILLDNQFILYLVCNKRFKSEVNKSKTKLKVQGNCGTLLVNHRSNIPGYDQTTWFDNKAITNIVSLKNIIKQYRVTYVSNDETFFM